MITRWIQRKGYERLLIFFNGWGMDGGIADFLQSNTTGEFDRDILLCYDYRTTGFPDGLPGDIAAYGGRMVVAWSLGVWAAQRTGLEKVDKALALNGTPWPVSTEKGIPPDIFRATLDNYDEESRLRFLRRMCGSTALFKRFMDFAPQRDAADQQEELDAILQEVTGDTVQPSPAWEYTHAVIGGRDMVFPAAAQERAWSGIQRKEMRGMPHFPFFEFNNWQEICKCMEA